MNLRTSMNPLNVAKEIKSVVTTILAVVFVKRVRQRLHSFASGSENNTWGTPFSRHIAQLQQG
jgi:hypothetical protein